MLQVVNGLLSFPKYKVTYIQHGEQLENYTDDKLWWKALAEKWNHTEIISINDFTYSEEEAKRLQEVEHLPEMFKYFAEQYIFNGLFPDQLTEEEGYMKEHPLKKLQLEKNHQIMGQQSTELEIENLMLKGQIQNLGQQNTELEIENITTKGQVEMLGQQVTELELQLLMKNNEE